MSDTTKIEWTATNGEPGFTFNPWIGCTAVSSACDHCYAEAMVKRYGGDFSTRRRTSETNWRKPLKWNKDAAAAGVRRKVFCASLADVFDNQVPAAWRADLWDMVLTTQHLDWLLLTKRPQNIRKMLPGDISSKLTWPWPNVWLGTTVENQEEADRRIPHLLAVPARVRFLSCEPLLGAISFAKVPGFNRIGLDLSNWWVICGGESGPGKRPMDIAHARSLRDQCANAGVPFFMKQIDKVQPIPDDLMVRQFPRGGTHV